MSNPLSHNFSVVSPSENAPSDPSPRPSDSVSHALEKMIGFYNDSTNDTKLFFVVGMFVGGLKGAVAGIIAGKVAENMDFRIL